MKKRKVIVLIILTSIFLSVRIVYNFIQNKDSYDFLDDYAILVIESDDWGGAFWTKDKLSKLQYFEEYGTSTLETTKDLKNLFEVLKRHEDYRGNSVVFQPNYVVANIDTKTGDIIELPDFPLGWERDSLWHETARDGIENNIWKPQLHWYTHNEHRQWKVNLENDSVTQIIAKKGSIINLKPDDNNPGIIDLKKIEEDILSANRVFESYFLFSPLSVIPPNYRVSQEFIKKMDQYGFIILQGYSALIDEENVRNKIYRRLKTYFHRNGSPTWENENVMGLSRNVHFEPFHQEADLGREQAVEKIEKLWKNSSFVILSTHRTNFAQLDSNRSNYALSEFDKLIEEAAIIADNLGKKLLFLDNIGLAKILISEKSI